MKMKTLYAFSILLLVTSQTFAQFGENRWMLGGNFNLSNTTSFASTSHDNRFNFGLSASIGRTFGKGNIIGLSASVMFSSVNATFYSPEGVVLPTTTISTKTFPFSYGAYYRKYYSLSDKFFLFAGGSAGLGTTRFVDNNAGQNTQNTMFNIALTPGIAWKVSDRILLNGKVNLASFYKYLNDNTDKADLQFGLNLPTLGINYLMK